MTQTKNDFTQGSIPKLITKLAMPMISAEIINALYSIVDRMYIGRIPGVGTLALTGIGVTFPFIMIISAFAMLAGMGGAPLCSIARGEKNDDYAEQIIGNSFTMLIVFGVILTIVGLIVKRPVLLMFGASEHTLPFAEDYITFYLIGTMFVMICLGMNPFINAQGFTRMGMITVAVGAALNILLDPLFIFVLGMGIRGAALATIVSQCGSALLILSFLTGKRSILRLKLKYMKPDVTVMRKICALGVSTFTMNLTECTVQIACNVTLSQYGGDTFVGVMTIINSIRQVLMMPMSGFAQGLQPVIGYNYGARRYDRVRKGIMFTTLVCASYSLVTWGIIELMPDVFIRLFNADAKMLEAGVPSVRIYFSMFFIMCLQMAGQRSFVALGKSKQAIFFSLLRKAFIVAPLVLILPRMGMGVNGVFIAEPISDFIGSTACFGTFMLTVWPKLKMEEDTALQ